MLNIYHKNGVFWALFYPCEKIATRLSLHKKTSNFVTKNVFCHKIVTVFTRLKMTIVTKMTIFSTKTRYNACIKVSCDTEKNCHFCHKIVKGMFNASFNSL